MASIEERIAKRPKCFGAANLKDTVCFTSASDKCPAFDDCYLIVNDFNSGYDPKVEQGPENNPSFEYSKLSAADKAKVEALIDQKHAAAAGKAGRSRGEAAPTAEPAKPGRRGRPKAEAKDIPVTPAPNLASAAEDDLLGSLNSELGGLDSVGKEAKVTQGPAEDIELSLTDAQETKIEKEAEKAATTSIEEPVRNLKTPTMSSEMDMVESVINMFFNRLESTLAKFMPVKASRGEKKLVERDAPALEPEAKVVKKRKPRSDSGKKRDTKASKRSRK